MPITIDKCPRCGGRMEVKKSTFEMRVFVTQGGTRKGELNFSVTPDGLDVPTCTENGCGETLMDKALAVLLDATAAHVHRTEPSLIAYLTTVREAVQFGNQLDYQRAQYFFDRLTPAQRLAMFDRWRGVPPGE